MTLLTSTVVGRAFHLEVFGDIILGPTQMNAPHNYINAVKIYGDIFKAPSAIKAPGLVKSVRLS